ncbi:MAG TPA: NnrS family protein, partial [Hyphomicrobiaceae bacterium]
MATTAERIRTYRGPAILSYGFRPFFLLGAIWAALVVVIWLPLLAGSLSLPTAFSPIEWHVHELVYGYVPAVMAGFLLTAVPNWTGRLPVTGIPLLLLVTLWAAGRLAILFSGRIGMATAAVVDLLFLATLVIVIAREIVAGQNLHNLKVLVLVGLLLGGNALFHAEAILMHGAGGYGARIGIGAAVLLITLIGGRIVPSFTRNWLVRERPGRLPTPFDRFDALAIAAGALAIACWVGFPL